MKLWLLRPTELGQQTNWTPWYDKNFGFVVRAKNTTQARNLADKEAADENRGEFLFSTTSPEKHPWLNPEYSTCIELTTEGDSEVICVDHRSA